MEVVKEELFLPADTMFGVSKFTNENEASPTHYLRLIVLI